jgi:hypothetical protein
VYLHGIKIVSRESEINGYFTKSRFEGTKSILGVMKYMLDMDEAVEPLRGSWP